MKYLTKSCSVGSFLGGSLASLPSSSPSLETGEKELYSYFNNTSTIHSPLVRTLQKGTQCSLYIVYVIPII